MKQKIYCLLFSPNFKYVEGSIYHEVSNLDPPLGLISLSAFMLENGFETMVFDLNVEVKSNAEISDFLEVLNKKYDLSETVFGISFLTPYAHSSYAIAEQLKIKFPNSTIVAGGAHATFMADEVLKSGVVDIVVRGEGEFSLLEIVQKNDLEKIQGISFLRKNEENFSIIHNAERERIKDINSLPFPAYHQLQMKYYKPILGSYRRLPAANIITTRGCRKCNFCCKVFGSKISFKSPKIIIEEIKMLVEVYKVKHINIYDDTFTLNKKRVVDFCNLLIESPLKLNGPALHVSIPWILKH